MPYRDGTGPDGVGPTGMRRGGCIPACHVPRQYRGRMRTLISPQDERQDLVEQKKYMESVLKDVNERIDQLKK